MEAVVSPPIPFKVTSNTVADTLVLKISMLLDWPNRLVDYDRQRGRDKLSKQRRRNLVILGNLVTRFETALSEEVLCRDQKSLIANLREIKRLQKQRVAEQGKERASDLKGATQGALKVGEQFMASLDLESDITCSRIAEVIFIDPDCIDQRI